MDCQSANLRPGTIFGYTMPSTDAMYQRDVRALHQRAAKSRKKLVIFGGLHGYSGTGEPVGQHSSEGMWIRRTEESTKRVGTGINFTYKNVARYSTNGSDVSAARQKELINLAKGYADSGGWIVLVAWCYSLNWLNHRL